MISEKVFESDILPHLLKSKRGYDTKYSLYEYFLAIIHRLKTGCQWRELPIKQFFSGDDKPIWQSVYYHYTKWCKSCCFKTIWENLALKFKDKFDLSVINIDGSHTPAKRGGDCVEYQGRKKCKTTNMLFITDKNGNFLACSDPISGNHNDSYELVENFKKMKESILLKDADMPVLNADSGFDSMPFYICCTENNVIPNIKDNIRNKRFIDEDNSKLIFPNDYTERFSIERSFAWIDSFKLLLTRYEVQSSRWLQLHFLAFSILLLKKYNFV